ncbi:rRNA maturation RNase YbeY [Rhodospirillum rubrum]|uniref:rRNA maturation RNase YbeY n=1 Tax=Rhodospirillum rubrum TaxID=1085 RepID=UPI0019045219|nr:rRNA maturation RNase YbeY [Rhodospirillum rubrum]MBK1664668.1 rRNA maturation RNase YbeY [Rhodospirillum rubrum]MBK1677765.1 rRNA maturation RNase YbeY [Rhodospirillum rubrum]
MPADPALPDPVPPGPTAPVSTDYPVRLAVDGAEGPWEALVPGVAALVEQAVLAAVAAGDPSGYGLTPGTPLEISLLLTDDAAVQALNRDYRGQDKPTNVLSFAALDAEEPLPEDGEPVLLGDVALARETVAREAADLGVAPADHVFHLVVHGVLHLLGYDHEEEEEALDMEGLETAILGARGIADPYADARGPEQEGSDR